MLTNKDILISIKNLRLNFKNYLGVAHVIDDISLDINKNCWYGLAGESGCGKSVTAYTILRILPESAIIEGGEILFKGKDLLKKSEREMLKIRGSEISIVFQEPHSALNPSMTIGDHLLEALKLHKKISRKSEREYILDMLEKVRFINPQYRLKQYPHELSGGMKQRICIAMALFANPSLLIADEFTTALDVTIQQEIINTVKELQKQLHISILFITHDLALIYNTCKYVAIMYAGEIVEKGEVEKVFRNPSHPYTQALLESVTIISTKSGKLNSLQGFVPSLIDPPSGCRFNTRCKYKIDNVCDKTFPEKTVVEEGHEVWCYLFNK
jgi:oligopeptide/dipeptide ABC transporter ATP-binding protein